MSTRIALAEVMAADPSVVVLGETAGRDEETRALTSRFPDRVICTPVADRGALGLAVGLALAGKRPVLSLAGPDRVAAALEVLAEAAAVARAGEFAVPLVVRVPYGTEAGRLDRPVAEALASIEGLRVVAAGSAEAAVGLLRSALGHVAPVVLLEPRAFAGQRAASEPLPLGAARVLRPGDHVTLAAWGGAVPAALDAAEGLARSGVSAGVVDLVSLAPLDRDTLGAEVRRTGRLVVVHPGDPGFADAVLRVALDAAFLYLEAPPARVDASADPVAVAQTTASY